MIATTSRTSPVAFAPPPDLRRLAARAASHTVGTFVRKADADRAFALAVSDQARGKRVRPDGGTIVLSDYAQRWLESRLARSGAPLRPRVRELYEGQLRLHILPTLGAVPLGRLSPAVVRRWYASLVADGPGGSTTAKCYRLLRAILNTEVNVQPSQARTARRAEVP